MTDVLPRLDAKTRELTDVDVAICCLLVKKNASHKPSTKPVLDQFHHVLRRPNSLVHINSLVAVQRRCLPSALGFWPSHFCSHESIINSTNCFDKKFLIVSISKIQLPELTTSLFEQSHTARPSLELRRHFVVLQVGLGKWHHIGMASHSSSFNKSIMQQKCFLFQNTSFVFKDTL